MKCECEPVTITLYRDRGCWMAEIVAADGRRDDYPTPHLSTTAAEIVRAAIAERNPTAIVRLRREAA